MQADSEIEPERRSLFRAGGIALLVGSVATVVGSFLAVMANSSQADLSIPSATQKGLAELQTQGLSYGGFWISVAAYELLSLVSFLALYFALRRVNQTFALVGLMTWVVGVTIDIAGDISTRLSMLGISSGYMGATSDGQREAYAATAQAALASSGVVAFIVGVPLGVALILFGYAMLKDETFGRQFGYLGIIAGVLEMAIFTGGDLTFWGYSSALQIITAVSGAPLLIWSFLVGYRLYKLGRGK